MRRSSAEISVVRRQNQWYINDDPTWVILTPHPEIRSPAGGYVRQPGTPRAPQRVRLIPSDREPTVSSSQADFGSTQREVVVEIMGDVDFEVDIGDRFTLDGVEHAVTEVQPDATSPFLRRATAVATPPNNQES